jgi:hypothetical protein
MNSLRKSQNTEDTPTHTKHETNAINSSERAKRRRMFRSLSDDSESEEEEEELKKIDYSKASIWSKMFYSWTSTLIEQASHGELGINNIIGIDSPVQLIKVKLSHIEILMNLFVNIDIVPVE